MFARSLALLVLAAALAGCGGGADREDPPLQGAPREAVAELDNVLQLRSDFEAAAGRTRLLVLFSPT
jgi:hypothetical protein